MKISLSSWLLASIACLALLAPVSGQCVSWQKLDSRSRETLASLYAHRPAVRSLVQGSAGVLVFPRVYKAGIGIGGEYGEGVLMQRGRTTGYYSIASGSIGLQLGGQRRSVVIAFTSARALAKFKGTRGWKAGVDGSAVVAKLGTGGEIDTNTANQPVIAFFLGERGLMYNATLEGSKISRLDK